MQGVLSQDSSARIPQLGVSSQSVWGLRWSHFGSKILVPRSWYPGLSTQMLVPKNGELERQSLSKIERGGAGGMQAPPTWGLGDWKPPQELQGVWGASAPQ